MGASLLALAKSIYYSIASSIFLHDFHNLATTVIENT